MEFEKPKYSMTFDDVQGQVVKAETDIHELTKKVLHSLNPAPVIGGVPEDTFVKLPAGLIVDNKVVQDAEVQELTGEHEERLAKVSASNNPAKYVNTLLQCGVVSIGNTAVTPKVLETLLQGDLDMLLLGIRRATFGNEFEVFNVPCPSCGEESDIKLDLKDIPIKELDDPEIREFVVPLRKGRKAKIKFPNGEVQNKIYEKQLSVPEMNSITLAHCVITFIGANGVEAYSEGLSDIKKLGIPDRNTLQKYIYENQPGPRYDHVVAKCHSCEGEVPVPLSVGILFREI